MMTMVSSLTGAAPRRADLLIVGCGDVGLRVVRELRGRLRVIALTSSHERVAALRQAGVTPLVGNLDEPRTLARLSGLRAGRALSRFQPPPSTGVGDPRLGALLAALALQPPAPALRVREHDRRVR